MYVLAWFSYVRTGFESCRFFFFFLYLSKTNNLMWLLKWTAKWIQWNVKRRKKWYTWNKSTVIDENVENMRHPRVCYVAIYTRWNDPNWTKKKERKKLNERKKNTECMSTCIWLIALLFCVCDGFLSCFWNIDGDYETRKCSYFRTFRNKNTGSVYVQS